MGTIKDRNHMDLTEATELKKKHLLFQKGFWVVIPSDLSEKPRALI